MSRDVRVIICGGSARTCTLPNTVVTVSERTFEDRPVLSVRLNDGLKILERYCFSGSGIRRLVLPSTV